MTPAWFGRDPQVNSRNWYVLFAPARTPQEIVNRLNGAVRQVVAAPTCATAGSNSAQKFSRNLRKRSVSPEERDRALEGRCR
jgi:tripartite-type tricarboxylate transporter receptor subunit TctC